MGLTKEFRTEQKLTGSIQLDRYFIKGQAVPHLGTEDHGDLVADVVEVHFVHERTYEKQPASTGTG